MVKQIDKHDSHILNKEK